MLNLRKLVKYVPEKKFIYKTDEDFKFLLILLEYPRSVLTLKWLHVVVVQEAITNRLQVRYQLEIFRHVQFSL